MQLAEQFDRAAGRYDLLTRLNPGYHRALRRAAADLVARLRPGPSILLDLGCGSGLSTQALLAAAPEARILGLDASDGMLEQARAKDWSPGVTFVRALAQDLPEVAARELDGPADGVLAAYLMRNVPEEHRDAVVEAIRDQVIPGGWVALQDYHVRGDAVAQVIWTIIVWTVVVPLAAAVRGNPQIYRYLWRSVLDNDGTADLQARLERAGLTDITWTRGPGWQRRILHTVLARRPGTEETP